MQIDYRQAETSGSRARWSPLSVLASIAFALAVLTGAVILLLSSMGRPRAHAQIVKCQSNLRQVAQDLFLYADANGGRYPLTIDAAVTDESPYYTYACPNADPFPAQPAGPTTRRSTLALLKAGGGSYVYAGAGQPTNCPPNVVLLYEPPGNHPVDTRGNLGHNLVDGANVIFANGEAVLVPSSVMASAISELRAGQNPPPSLKAYTPTSGTAATTVPGR